MWISTLIFKQGYPCKDILQWISVNNKYLRIDVYVLWISVFNYPCLYGYPFVYPWISMDIHALTCYGFSIRGKPLTSKPDVHQTSTGRPPDVHRTSGGRPKSRTFDLGRTSQTDFANGRRKRTSARRPRAPRAMRSLPNRVVSFTALLSILRRTGFQNKFRWWRTKVHSPVASSEAMQVAMFQYFLYVLRHASSLPSSSVR